MHRCHVLGGYSCGPKEHCWSQSPYVGVGGAEELIIVYNNTTVSTHSQWPGGATYDAVSQ